MAKILVLHGPNLNLLGTREPEVYGHTTLEQLNQSLVTKAKTLGHELHCQQSNAEAEIIDGIQNANNNDTTFIIINPAAFTHTSVAIRDALLSVDIPFIEVHISNIYAREQFRQQSYLRDIAIGLITGFGIHSYHLALDAANHYLSQH